jgi:hypothetical protein
MSDNDKMIRQARVRHVSRRFEPPIVGLETSGTKRYKTFYGRNLQMFVVS